MNPQDIQFYDLLLKTALEAGKAIMNIYADEANFGVEIKDDNSPLTKADKAANAIIVEALKTTGIPIISEEEKNKPYSDRKNWEKCWLVDPLDGTKEFIKRNGEFTVNIALIDKQKPVLGIVYAPVLKEIFIGEVGKGAFKIFEKDLNLAVELPIKRDDDTVKVVASRSHLSKETQAFIDDLKETESNAVESVSKGSSLKLCLIAEGVADYYPRFAPTMEWDTAAGHALINAANKVVLQHNSSEELKYNKEDLLNPWFLAK